MKYTANVTCLQIKPILLPATLVVLQRMKDAVPVGIVTVVATAEEEMAAMTVAAVEAITEVAEAAEVQVRADRTAVAVRADREKNVKENYGSRIMVGGKSNALNYSI